MRKLLKSDYLDYLGRQPRGLPTTIREMYMKFIPD